MLQTIVRYEPVVFTDATKLPLAGSSKRAVRRARAEASQLGFVAVFQEAEITRLLLTTEIEAPIELCFDLARDIDVHVVSMGMSSERTIGGIQDGLINLDEEVTWEARHFGIRWRMRSRVTALEFPNRFVDEMQQGPFAKWHHEHIFQKSDSGTTMTDLVEYRIPLGPIGRLVDTLVLQRHMRRLLQGRNRHIKVEAERRQ